MQTFPLPKGRGGLLEQQLICRPGQQTTIALYPEPLPEGGEVLADNHDLPLSTKSLYVQNRMAGDWYVEIDASRHVSAVAAAKNDAFLGALAQVPA